MRLLTVDRIKKSLVASRLLCWLLLVGMVIPAMADQSSKGQKTEPDLSVVALEDLLNIEVVSASKKEQKVSETAAAIYVITAEDIRRSSATTIPALLRMVPGVNVAQISANKYAVTIRGFNSRFANKLLVMIDGRSVYTPMFSGVFWDVQDTVLEDIDRIEVIRGPGGTLWGGKRS